MIEYIEAIAPYILGAAPLMASPALLRRYLVARDRRDDRAILAHLYAVGRVNRGAIVGSVYGVDKGRVEHALVRLCNDGRVERSDGAITTLSGLVVPGPPNFGVADCAEALIDD